MKDVTLLTNVFNEAFLLPYWLEHHKPLVTRLMVLDYGSTDGSLEIIKNLVPEAEIYQSDNLMFDAWHNDEQIMELEKKCHGWKIALNTTEFIFKKDFLSYLNIYNDCGINSLAFNTMAVVDHPTLERPNPVVPGVPLWQQRKYGYRGRYGSPHRFMHRMDCGRYTPGRHTSSTGPQSEDPRIPILWYGWAPFEQVKARKLQIQSKIPQSDKDKGFGHQHLVTPEKLEQMYQEETKKIIDLTTDEIYATRLKEYME